MSDFLFAIQKNRSIQARTETFFAEVFSPDSLYWNQDAIAFVYGRVANRDFMEQRERDGKMQRQMIWLVALAVIFSGCNSAKEEKELALPPSWEEAEEMATAEQEKPSLPDDAPVLTLTPAELEARFSAGTDYDKMRADFAAASQGHWIEFTGVVSHFRQEGGTGAPGAYVTLREAGELEKFAIPKTAEVIMQSPAEAWEKLKPGDDVTIRCVWGEWTGFHDGRVISGGGSPAQRTTAKELIDAIKADKAAAKEKYHDKYWIVTGLMADKQPYQDHVSFSFDKVYYSTVMQGDDDISIAMELPHQLVVTRLEPQEEVEILGKIKILDEDQVNERHPLYVGIVDGSRIDLDKQ
ncbi:hypothetical protein [Blastopirellula marina]|uniref:Uncharacterized protein n=1 Tax=Blastopirellula marina TaxID=124 RepID=A0A2S8FWN1_9BACT|nr:hypothetical protein [Blastopirellula marina]PQO36586.1 hypothetical protein C5Y98_11360 [Blastopirellula marina]PTL44416.1 hypothetical protein C5Y97_11370 [Blastopirellula marina]